MNNKQSLYAYRWHGINREGQTQQGLTVAKTIPQAIILLRKQGIAVQYIRRKHLFLRQNKPVKSHVLIQFCLQLVTMLRAGLSLIQAIDLLIQKESNIKIQTILIHIKASMAVGRSFTESLQQHPHVFNALICTLIEAGEQSGTLETMLAYIATYTEKITLVRNTVKKALYYPSTLFLLACLMVVGTLLYLVPLFEQLFIDLNAPLPLLTNKLVQLSHGIKKYGLIVFFIIVGFCFSLFKISRSSGWWHQHLELLFLKCPFIGKIIHESAISRFTRTLSITLAAGLPLMKSLSYIGGAAGLYPYEQATEQIKKAITQGQSISIAMNYTRLFPPMVVQWIAIGEESGQLEHMLSKLADFYEEKMDNTLSVLCRLLEPIIMTIIGLFIGGLMMMLYLPLINIGALL